jgi:hypothetical protein
LQNVGPRDGRTKPRKKWLRLHEAILLKPISIGRAQRATG